MPEGPEITYFSVFLKKKLANYKLYKINSFTDKPVLLPKNNEWEGDIIDVECKGKVLWFYITGKNQNYYMHIHYGLTGWFQFEKPENYIKFELLFKNVKNDKKIILYMEDKRRFSKINIFTEKQHNMLIDKIGIDLFSDKFTLEKFKNTIKSKNTLLAAFLLKQEIFSGIGNYIKNEAMFMGKLKVTVKTSELTNSQINKLYDDILFVGYSNLIEMLYNSQIVKYLDLSKKTFMPIKLEIPYIYKIYGRETTDDGKKILKIKIAGRDTYCIKELC